MSRNVAAQAQQAPQDVLAGIVERVTFHNEENGFCVLRVKARGHRDLVTVVGGVVLRNRALNCCPCVRSLNHSPVAVIHSPAEIAAECPTTVTRSRCPRALTRSTQKPFSSL